MIPVARPATLRSCPSSGATPDRADLEGARGTMQGLRRFLVSEICEAWSWLVVCMLFLPACFYYEPIEDPVFNRLPVAVFPPLPAGDPSPEPVRPQFNGTVAELSIQATDEDDADIHFVWDEFAGLDYEEPNPPRSFEINGVIHWKSEIIVRDYTPVRGDVLTTWLSDGHGDELTPVPWLMEPR